MVSAGWKTLLMGTQLLSLCVGAGGELEVPGHRPPSPRDLYQPSPKAFETESTSPPHVTRESWALLPFPVSSGLCGSMKACRSLGSPARPMNHLTFELAGPFHPVGQESFLTFTFLASQVASGWRVLLSAGSS